MLVLNQEVMLRHSGLVDVNGAVPNSLRVSGNDASSHRLYWVVELTLFEVFGIAPVEQDPFENKTTEWDSDCKDCADDGDDRFS